MVRLFVKENETGIVHEYGTNPHDALIVNEDGSLHYLNMQNCSGTLCPEEGYSFCSSDGDVPNAEDMDESYLDIGGEYYNDKLKGREEK